MLANCLPTDWLNPDLPTITAEAARWGVPYCAACSGTGRDVPANIAPAQLTGTRWTDFPPCEVCRGSGK